MPTQYKATKSATSITILPVHRQTHKPWSSDPEAISDLDGLRGALADSIAELEVAV